ncbi:hypothetical protein [Sphingobacterium multivorum]|uniref:hypothetical protein n=1 Tax=Sphingobacterium multivorum TaxID=28454 RepID=UPI0011BE296A|nr:hypothetical protein [Sphingobacterium multivorum]QRQ61579.1 hypothetical protein I6J33_00795 [Sphingobacterium multivorum]
MRDSFCKTGDRRAGMVDSAAEWDWEPDFGAGFTGKEGWTLYCSICFRLNSGNTLVALLAQCPIEDGVHWRSRWTDGY